mmetsp:Transcript_6566/g.18317  ORF Transcript_6566/g.18317 Transcript_6566/m.18317 type:complete len:199 (-) Transcript_6566:322-918(-)|eukprot:CAMPEP_0117652706 /NCGR_PEP_ID=MMETSP0804-20121206/2778_1 /TAXON_ID=1074897 /ORGANISM="Tetraselmis astigmatica, Strain CCMP880" /LENGTH=198 /DNA_ID=CAMNT_0005458787 /DNA_START=391 /DNA_END=987 /DNA_ORIENTATION=+
MSKKDSTLQSKRVLSKNTVIHDTVNLYVLPWIGIMALLGICGIVDGMKTTIVFTVYILLDLAWIALQPDAVPAMPGLIIFHHIITLILLAYPLRYPRFAIYSNWDGLVELNTFFLIARRQVKEWRTVMSRLFWVTFWPTRFVIHPYLITQFWQVTAPCSLFERLLVTAAQTILVGFNFMFLYRAMPVSFRDKLSTYVG